MIAEQIKLEKKLDKEISEFLHKNDDWNIDFTIEKNISFAEFLSNPLLIIAVIRAGIPYSLFGLIQKQAPYTETNWADFLSISTKTLQRYKKSKSRLKPIHSEKIIEMAEVTRTGVEVFGSMDKFNLWLNTPNYALGEMKPIDLLNGSYGKNLVMEELVRIEHGILI